MVKDGCSNSDIIRALEWGFNKNIVYRKLMQDVLSCCYLIETTRIIQLIKWIMNRCDIKLKPIYYYDPIYSGNLDMVKYLRSIGVPLVGHVLNYAVDSGNFPIMNWMVDKCEKKYDAYEAKFDSVNKQIRVLEWLEKHKFPKSKCAFESLSGCNIKVLKWLENHNFPLSKRAFDNAIESKKLKNAKWIWSKGCRINNSRSLMIGMKTLDRSIVSWLLETLDRNILMESQIFSYMSLMMVCNDQNINRAIEIAKMTIKYGLKISKWDMSYDEWPNENIKDRWQQLYDN
jgi:hypothetical protein